MDDNLLDNYINQLKNHYYELYVIILLAHNNNFKRLILLSNLFIEINTISNKTSDKMIGFVRLMWWREVLFDLKENKVKNHPLIENLKYIDDSEYNNLINIIESIEAIIEAENDHNLENNIKKKYSNFLELLDINNELAIVFFIVNEVLLKKIYNFSKLNFYIQGGNLNTKKIIDKLNNDFTMKSSNLPTYLLEKSLKFYIKKTKENYYDIYKIDINRLKIKILINLYFNFYIFKIKSCLHLK